MKRIIPILGLLLAASGCSGPAPAEQDTLVTSIGPIQYIVERITGDDMQIRLLVPPGTSPETYEPTPAQLRELEDARLIFGTGLLSFEKSLTDKLANPQKTVNLSAGIELLEGSCEHSAAEHTEHGHTHGTDPHIWTTPSNLKRMAATAYSKIHEQWPDSTKYAERYQSLQQSLDSLDLAIRSRTEQSAHRVFLIFHPGLEYYAREYGLRQIALEHEGKEPSARQLADLLRTAQSEQLSRILYQREFPRTSVDAVAKELGAEAVEIDLLGYDILMNLSQITDLITSE